MRRGGPSAPIRMDKALANRVDEVVRTAKNELNQKRFNGRGDFLDHAVRKFLISQKFKVE